MFDPRDAGWRRAVWFAAVGAAVGGPLGYLITRLSGAGEFGWPAFMALVAANSAALLPRPGWLIALVTGTVMGLVYLMGGVLGYVMIVGGSIRAGVDWFATTDAGFWSLAGGCATLSALGIAWWITREQRMW